MATTPGRRTASKFNPFLAALLILVAVVGTLVTLELTGKTNLGLVHLWDAKAGAPEIDTTGVIMSTRALQPGEQIGLSAVVDPTTRAIKIVQAPSEMVEANQYATGYPRIRGRVLARAKAANEPFVADDFLPADALPGLVGLIPEGLELLILDADKVQGLEVLGFKNHFDLQVSESLDSEIQKAAEEALGAGKHISPGERLQLAVSSNVSSRRVLAQNGMVLRPAQQGGKKTTVAVALHPDDIGPTLEALAGKATIYCVARATNGADFTERVIYEKPDPVADFQWLLEARKEVEVIKGNARNLEVVPAANPR